MRPVAEKKKKLKDVRSGVISRGFKLAGLGLSLGTQVLGDTIKGKSSDSLLKQMRKLSTELGRLKGSVMKVGQMLSVYGEHFFPPEVNAVLKELQSESPAVEWPAMKKHLTRQIGKTELEELEFEEEAYAAASLGQVHRAKIKKTGEMIAVKIQYPGVDKAIDSDIRALRFILSFSEFLPKIPATDDLFEEVRFMLRKELDYDKEREELEYFLKHYGGNPLYKIPRPIPHYSNKRVLAMEYVEGFKVDSPEVQRLSQERRNDLAVSVLKLYFDELFVHRKMQTDPHFGNYRIQLKPDRWVLYDFGAVRDISQKFMDPYTDMLRGVLREDWDLFESSSIKLKVLDPSDPPELKKIFRELCALIVEPFQENKPYKWSGTTLPKRVSEKTFEMLKRFPLRSPPREVVFLDRKMAGMFTLMAALGAEFNARAVLEPYLK